METRSSSSSSNQLVLLVLVILLTLPNCSASKGTKKDGVKVPGREHDMNKAKVDLSINLPLSVEITRVNLGGRKMMSEGNTGMSNGRIKTEEGKKQSAAGEAAASKNISGASSVKKRKLNMQSKMSSTSTKLHGGKVNMGGFMALDADYDSPRAHPPRNN